MTRPGNPDPDTVLYVDDEGPNRLIVEALLAGRVPLVSVASAEEALAWLDAHPAAVLVTDHRMPGMSGVELCEVVRERHPLVVRILVTAFSDHDTVVAAVNRGGVDAYLPKPWEPAKFVEAIERAVVRARRQREAAELRAIVRESEQEVQRSLVRGMVMPGVEWAVSKLRDVRRRLVAAAHDPETVEEIAGFIGVVADGLEREVQVGGAPPRRPAEPVSLADVCAVLEPMLLADLCGVARLEVDCPAEVEVLADRVALAAIVMNLVQNAGVVIRTGQGRRGVVRVAAEARGLRVWLRVVDTAPPPPPSLVARIFEPHVGGIGPGVAREIAERAGWPLSFEPGEAGNAFVLELPRAPARSEAAQARDSSAAHRS